jgi:DNA protecting protein DprA
MSLIPVRIPLIPAKPSQVVRSVLSTMPCTPCRRRSALIAALAPAISNLSFTRHGLLALLALPNERLLRAVKVKDPDEFLRGLELPLPTERVPTALCRHNRDYPEALRQLPSAPAVLYATCTIERLRELLSKPTVAIAGSSEHTPYGEQIASELARDLAAAGVTVISGMNKGLEGIIQRGALGARGHTIAVMSGCAEMPFPSRHKNLHRGIRAHGAAVSEFPPGFFPPPGWCFISSQRILAALAPIVVVVEAGKYSCALLTAQIAADLGADVAVVPGRVTDPGGKWTFALLRDGAHPVSCAQDVVNVIYGAGARGAAA